MFEMTIRNDGELAAANVRWNIQILEMSFSPRTELKNVIVNQAIGIPILWDDETSSEVFTTRPPFTFQPARRLESGRILLNIDYGITRWNLRRTSVSREFQLVRMGDGSIRWIPSTKSVSM